MARYFLHLKDSTDCVLDPEGMEMGEDAVAGIALAAARDCIAGDVKEGRIDLHYRIEVFTDKGDLVHVLQFADAVEMVSAR
jgi:hypothetical protein